MRVILFVFLYAMGFGTAGAVEAGAHWGWFLYAALGALLILFTTLACTRDRNPAQVRLSRHHPPEMRKVQS